MLTFIDVNKHEYGVEPIFKELQIAPSTYYAAISRPHAAEQRLSIEGRQPDRVDSFELDTFDVHLLGKFQGLIPIPFS